jgi:CBS domain containing-hemolysin-like protein
MNELAIIIITLVASAFFSGMEIAFVSSDKLRMELDKSKNLVNAKIISKFNANPGQYIATLLVGNNIALVVYSLTFAQILNQYMVGSIINETPRLFVQTLISTLLILIMAEFLPKTVFRMNPNFALNVLAVPAAFFYFLFYPFTRIAITISKLTLKFLFNAEISQKQEQRIFGKIDLNNFIGEVENYSGEAQYEIESEIKLFKNALDFSKIRVRDCMVQRPDMELLEDTASIDQLRHKFIETGFSKILIYKDQMDNIIGYVHSSDLFNHPENIATCLRQASFVPETMEVKKLLATLLHEHKSIAVVIDEFGGTAGMITTEDILEEIFGEIVDEHDKPDLISRKINDKHFIFTGRLEIEAINEMYNLNLQIDSSYETLAGYILFHHASFPKTNSVLMIGKYEFKILRSTKTSIELVEMKLVGN